MTLREMSPYEWRAEMLARVMFTRRSDVVVRAPASPWDLLVELLEDGDATGQVFAVEVKAFLRPTDLGRAVDHGEIALDRDGVELLARVSQHVRDVPFPVCFIGFAMSTDEGYSAWVRRPVNDGSAEGLVTEAPEHLTPFTDHAIAEIIDTVRGWYRRRRSHAAAV